MEPLFEGYLTKSPPTKRIWRARWRRRWFVLKQGELPGQFFLEYYTDRNCRKLKGVIDLDQCEQVDAGLRMDKQKIKFQFMFDIKTPHRTYYLAADTENDAKNWVNLICQVCNLQETDETGQEVSRVQYYNIGPNGDITVEEQPSSSDEKCNKNEESNRTESTFLTNASSTQGPILNNSANEYENENVISYRHSVNYSNRETILMDLKLHQRKNAENVRNNNEIVQPDVVMPALNYSNLPPVVPLPSPSTIERSTSLRQNKTVEAVKALHQRTQSLDHTKKNATTGAIKKIPENLKLRSNTTNDDRINNNSANDTPTCISGASGPYIPLNECFSGSPVIFPSDHVPSTPLNCLNPKFYETPRSHNNIGLNLTQDQLQYSPKRINNNNNAIQAPLSVEKSQSGRSTPTDSESVFTDDEWAGHTPDKSHNTLERNLRPSDSSIENDAVGWTYVQRFSKGNQQQLEGNPPPPRPPKRVSLVLDGTEKLKEQASSDIENASPVIVEAIGPKESTSYVDESYDIPRSHQPKYFGSHSNIVNEPEGMFTAGGSIVSSTPNLIQEEDGTLEKRATVGPRPHYYSNAAPTKIEGNVFRYDFMESDAAPAPLVNRSLKPKTTAYDKIQSNGYGMIRCVPPSPGVKGAPTVDRKLKPAIAPKPQFGTNSLHRKGPASLSLSEADDLQRMEDSMISMQSFGLSPRTPDRLQYLDLDHTNSPQKPSSGPGPSVVNPPLITGMIHKEPNGTLGRDKKDAPGIAYTTIDIVKTDAFNRVREDSEATRASKSRGKN